MAGNSLGSVLKLATFGESHGPAMGGVLEGVPAGLPLNFESIQKELNRRKPGQSSISSPRKEEDQLEILSGVFEGKTLGTPIGFIIRNNDRRSEDYNELQKAYRPGHADRTYDQKYGHRDHRGGGRSSARETVSWVAAGAIARQIIPEVKITAWVQQLGTEVLREDEQPDPAYIEQNPIRTAHPSAAERMMKLAEQVRAEGDTLGGVIHCEITGVPAGWGQPVFQKLQAQLAHAMLSLNAVKGFSYGSGFSGSAKKGSEHNDRFLQDGSTVTNHSGGIQGGISTGAPLCFDVAFKPVSTLMRGQEGLTATGEIVTLPGKGRHDATVLPRAVPIVEALAALVLADASLQQRLDRWNP